MAVVQVPPLMEILAEIPDTRQGQGLRHPLAGMLNLASVATLCGYQNPNAIAEWGRNYGKEYEVELGFEEHGYPSTATWYRVLGGIDVGQLEAKVTRWIEKILSGLKETGGGMLGVSIDGKTLRGSKRQGAKNSHLLSAYVQEIGVVLAQVGVDDKTNEIGAIEEFLLGLALTGCVVTTDALLTQQKVTQTIVDRGGDYVLPVKENQALTYETIEIWFDAPAADCLPHQVAEMTEKKHGRLTHWRIETTTALNDYLDWPGLKQAFKITRRVVFPKTGVIQVDCRYGIASLAPERATPSQLLTFTRHHWGIENSLHWVRDVTFGEDRSVLHTGRSHHVMAILRNLALSLLHVHGYTHIASTLRLFAAQPNLALNLVATPLFIGE